MEREETLREAERLRREGREEEALQAYLKVAGDAATTFAPHDEALAMLGAAQLYSLNDEYFRAARAFQDAIARAVEAGAPFVEAEAWYGLACASFDTGRSKDGHDAVLEAMALYRDLKGQQAQRGLAISVRLYGEHVGVLGDTDEARQALELARVIFRELGEEEEAKGVDVELSRLGGYSR